MISAVVLTKNEEKNIGDCLDSLKCCEEIVVVDDYSTDNTIKRFKNPAKKAGRYDLRFKNLKIYKRHLNGDFATQRNYGLKHARGNWVFFVDDDERVSSQLREEIITMFKSAKVKKFNGFYLKRNDFFGGRWLKHGETAKVLLLRLARRGAGEWRGKVHECWKVKGKIGELKNPLLHYPHPTITEFLYQINYYSDLRAEELYSKGIRSSLFQIIGYPLAKFFQNWIVRLGFLDCQPGFIMAMMMSWHSFLVRSKLYLK